MSAQRGEQIIQRLKENRIELWHQGQRVEDITTEPGIAKGVATLAELYDIQWDDPETMLFDSPATGQKVGRSYLIPTTSAELISVGRMMQVWAEHTHGMMGRTPDYLNRSLAGFAGAADFLAGQDARFAQNMRTYFEYIRENDLILTHTLINPQINRSVGVAQQADPFLAARVKEENEAGLIIKGARMLATLPIADEIMVFPSTVLRSPEEEAAYAFAFCIPTATPGLKFISRETVDYGHNPFDHPLGSRFEELDAMVIFDDVFVPWERVFLYRDVEFCQRAYAATGAIAQMTYQVVCKNIAKTEFILGLASLLVDSIAVEQYQHIQEKMAEIWINLQTMKAFKRAAEADAALNEYGVMTPAWPPLDAARNLYPKLYPRMVEIIQQIGASGLVAMPTYADLTGPLAGEVIKYYQSARLDARDRIPLFRLAWDTAMSAFGSRQVLYERFFFGDPVRMAGMLFESHDHAPYIERVRDFLRRSLDDAEWEAAADGNHMVEVRKT